MNNEKITELVKQYRGYKNPNNSVELLMDHKYFIDVNEKFTSFSPEAGGKEKLGNALKKLAAQYPEAKIYASIYDIDKGFELPYEIYSDTILIFGDVNVSDIEKAFEDADEYIMPEITPDYGQYEDFNKALLIDENGEASSFVPDLNKPVTQLWWD